MPASPLIRSAHLADLPAILHIQARCYSAIVPESAASMGAKLAAAPDTCFVACRGGHIVAYLLALPWRWRPGSRFIATEVAVSLGTLCLLPFTGLAR